MQIQFRNVRKFQEGGPMEAAPEEMAPEAGAPVPEAQGGSGDPMEMLMQLAQGAAQALQGQDCQVAMQVCEGLIQFIEMAQGGGGAPEEQGAPVYRHGGRLAYRIRK